MSPTSLLNTSGKAGAYLRLMRVDRPIGIYLLLWPTMIALFLAADGIPSTANLAIFIAGTVVMRSAGCVINDYFDRDLDGHVARTRARPLATGELSTKEALSLFAGLCAIAFCLVLLTNPLTIKVSFAALASVCLYPLMKRFIFLPQLVLGVSFAFGILMAFTAESGELPAYSGWLFAASILWTVAYDTFYAMADREDDLKIGIRSTAIWFGDYDRLITGLLQIVTLSLMLMLGLALELHWPFYTALAISAGQFAHQQVLIKNREPGPCLRAFLLNHYVGLCWFLGVVCDLMMF